MLPDENSPNLTDTEESPSDPRLGARDLLVMALHLGCDRGDRIRDNLEQMLHARPDARHPGRSVIGSCFQADLADRRIDRALRRLADNGGIELWFPPL